MNNLKFIYKVEILHTQMQYVKYALIYDIYELKWK
jgi:hypothetical protein